MIFYFVQVQSIDLSIEYVSVSLLYIKYKNLPSWIVFLFTLSVVLITLVSVIFPALIMGSGEFKYKVDIFEFGILAFPLLLTNAIIFCLFFLYSKRFLPITIPTAIRRVFSFEVSAQVATLAVILLLGFYISFNINELLVKDPWEDYERTVLPALENWEVGNITKNITEPNLVYLFGIISLKIFGTYHAIAFIASIAVVVLTYFITKEISGKRFSGLVAIAILLQSNNFLTYDTTLTYSNFWVLFYLLSLYLIYKKWQLSPISFLFSIPSKAITIMYLPMNLFFAYRVNIPRRKKILIFSSYIAIIVIGTIIFVVSGTGLSRIQVFDSHSFLSGLTAFSAEFRFDFLIVLFILPLIVGLFFASRRGILEADAIMTLLGWILLLSAILPAFTEYDNNPYRYITFVVFFAVGTGLLFSKVKQPA